MLAEISTSELSLSSQSSSHETPEKKKKNDILEKGLKVFDIAKRAQLIHSEKSGDETNISTNIEPLPKTWVVKNIFSRSVVILTPWIAFGSSAAGMIVVAVQTPFFSDFPVWVNAFTASALGLALIAGCVSTGVTIQAERIARKAEKLHQKEQEVAYFNQFTAAFDNYKMQIEEMNQEKETKITLSRLIELLNQCSEEHQNKVFTREMWISELLYLAKKERKNSLGEKDGGDNEEEEESELDPDQILQLLKLAHKTAQVIEGKRSKAQDGENSKLRSKKHFSSETSGKFNDNENDDSYVSLRLKFDKSWQQIEGALGTVNYLAVGNVFIGRTGLIYADEQEAIEDYKSREESQENDSKNEVVININDS